MTLLIFLLALFALGSQAVVPWRLAQWRANEGGEGVPRAAEVRRWALLAPLLLASIGVLALRAQMLSPDLAIALGSNQGSGLRQLPAELLMAFVALAGLMMADLFLLFTWDRSTRGVWWLIGMFGLLTLLIVAYAWNSAAFRPGELLPVLGTTEAGGGWVETSQRYGAGLPYTLLRTLGLFAIALGAGVAVSSILLEPLSRARGFLLAIPAALAPALYYLLAPPYQRQILVAQLDVLTGFAALSLFAAAPWLPRFHSRMAWTAGAALGGVFLLRIATLPG